MIRSIPGKLHYQASATGLNQISIFVLCIECMEKLSTSCILTTHKAFVVRTLQWRHNECDGASNHQRLHCLLKCWFRCWSKEASKFPVTGLCVGNSPVTGEFPAQRASNAESVSIWWRHHDMIKMRSHVNNIVQKEFIMISCVFWLLQASYHAAIDYFESTVTL